VRQQSSVATQMKKTNFDYLFVSPDEIDRHMKTAFDLVARRAYELFENRGSEHGHDSEDWFQAESEIFHPVTIEMGDPGDAYTAVAVVSGYRPEDLKINAEPLRLIICGLSCAEDIESNRPQEGSQHAERFFFSISLPTEIDTAAVTADIRQDVLEVRLPKGPPRTEPEER
jgi:HSP20 family molecular chaperone IbpA